MYQAQEVKDHIEQSSTVESRAMILTEWNLNIAENIEKIGNYRYRPITTTDFASKSIATTYDSTDAGNDYTGATDSDINIDGGYDTEDNPIAFTTPEKKKEFLFSLEKCFDRFRPRSGINKMIYNEQEYINDASTSFATRPRYYLASREDVFKYWTSIRTENSKLTGISYTDPISGKFYINDAAPFVVYKNIVPTNRIITKVQTNVGTTGGTSFKNIDNILTEDPFYGTANMTVPKEWKVQYLDSNNAWQDAKTFDTVVFNADGYLELQYGLIVPTEYTTFIKAPNVNSVEAIPDNAPNGYSYLLIENTGDKGVYFTRNSTNTAGDQYNGVSYPGWDVWIPTYGWFIGNETVDAKSPMVTNLTDPDWYYTDETKTTKAYRDFSYIRGVRLVVTAMNKNDTRLDLIEISPRLAADLSGITRSYSTTREAADLSSSPFPVGSLVASTGSLDLFDYDLAFSNNNKRSILNVVVDDEIVYNISNKNMQIKFYEIIENVNDKDYYIPIKVLYADGFPEVSASERSTTMNLRDLFFMFESTSPQDTVMIDQPLSYIIATMLDSIGFSNYKFYRLDNETDDIIPYFFISKEAKVSQVLNELAVATQSAMFFDETNNLIIASRGYMFPKTGERKISTSLNGSKDQAKDGAYRNKTTQSVLANIMDIASQEDDIYNDGKITYSPKYIQKTVRSIEQASKLDKERNWVYKPVMLWQVSQSDATKSINGESSNSQGMALTAIPLKTKLTSQVPTVVVDDNGVPRMDFNYMSFGDSVYFVGRYNGYFYANGEIIRYDAVEYNAPASRVASIEFLPATSGATTISINNKEKIQFIKPGYEISAYDNEYFAQNTLVVSTNKSEGTVTISTPLVGSIPAPVEGTYVTGYAQQVSNNVWVSSLEEYEELFANIPFNGKLYPTGRVRIYAEAQYDENDNLVTGEVKKHGRGQFGTKIVSHEAGLSNTWKENKTGCEMNMSLLINGGKTILSTSGEIIEASETKNGQGLYTAKIKRVRSSKPFRSGQEISAQGLTTLSETGTIYSASTTTTGGLYTAKIKDLVSSDYFYAGQELDCTPGTGNFGTGNTVKVSEIISKTEIAVTGSNVKLNNGTVTNINAILDSGDLAGVVTITLVDSSTNTLSVSSTDKMTNGPISNITTTELPIGGYNLCGKTDNAAKYADVTTIDGLMKNYLSTNPLSEDPLAKAKNESQLIQSSALIINGPSFPSTVNPVDFMTYSYRKMDNAYKHFGTRMRIVGQSGTSEEKLQTPVGSAGWKTIDGKTVAGSSGGLSVLLNPDKNVGYYFEIAAFTDNNVVNYTGETSPINNVFFYKLRAQYDYVVSGDALVANSFKIVNNVMTPVDPAESLNITGVNGEAIGQIVLFEDQPLPEANGSWRIDRIVNGWQMTRVQPQAIPETIWAGLTSIVTDSGQFTGAGRVLAEQTPSVYDLAVEYVDNADKTRTFHLYINNIKVADVIDTDPAPAYDNIGLFARGSARVMFENFYAISSNYAVNTESLIKAPVNSVFTDGKDISQSAAFSKYALSGAIQSTYLSGIGTDGLPQYDLFYEEFGTIMRECAYFNIRYEDAYPALRAMVAPTFNTEKGYTISGFVDTPYGAEFLLFNNTDTVLAIDESTGNFLRILGVTFTQQSNHDLAVDDYFNEIGNLSSVENLGQTNLSKNKKRFQDIKDSRNTYGVKEFSLNSPYIQSRDTAEKLMEWSVDRLSKPRKSIGISMFANPLLQIGDLVDIDYKDKSGMDILGTENSQFVVYSIEYQKAADGPSMTVHLSEVY